ncbi:type II toxin-antitoxin system RelE/ParE family toxin [Phyllobacterium sp. TAF24]|uniref:type II toxin-antitoxin system RelE/ParE family toxin n=1 Tax=unclassified Phyllobacterium TaxID=2638441 RepID=UPI00087E2594|nr:type II toxin-antitoxin system RelE/ParE family toxin [Phyllobacterium sp. OV277]SDP03055.1 hypothetical protein SAMN05443582_103207 [Phyllobacterium sp. OV277]
MSWTVLEHPEFSREQKDLDPDVADKLDEVLVALGKVGPNLGRPLVDTLHGSKHTNMKEIRFALKGAWRFAFAFDPERQAVILIGGNKEGISQKRFYKLLIKEADKRFDEWLEAEE